MAVDVKLGGTAEIGAPHKLFDAPFASNGYGVFGDGQRFLFIEPVGEPPIAQNQRGVELGRRVEAMRTAIYSALPATPTIEVESSEIVSSATWKAAQVPSGTAFSGWPARCARVSGLAAWGG